MKKINLLSILIIICVVSVLGMAILFLVSRQDLNEIKEAKISEIDQLKNVNKNVLDEAQKMVANNVRPIDQTDHVKGDLNAPVKIMVYSDFECPFCASFVSTLNQVEKEFGEKVVIAFRHYPLRSHFNAIPAANASECASDQGKFWEMHDLLFKNASDDKLNNEQYIQNAKDLGLDLVNFSKCIEMQEHKDKIIASQIDGKEVGVSGTPGSFVNGEVVPGAVPFEDFKDSSGRDREGLKTIINRKLQIAN